MPEWQIGLLMFPRIRRHSLSESCFLSDLDLLRHAVLCTGPYRSIQTKELGLMHDAGVLPVRKVGANAKAGS